jgi:CII-binding regulator of phage lambda lysogenization HflD
MPDADLHRALGNVEGQLKAQTATLERLLDAIGADRTASEKSRDTVTRDLDAIDKRLSKVEEGIERISPVADEVKQWKQRGIGAAMLLSMLGATFGGALVAFREKILAVLGISN